MQLYQIVGSKRVAAFIVQIGHESAPGGTNDLLLIQPAPFQARLGVDT